MQTVAYLLLALAIIGALAYALFQVNARQKRLMAELTRLERLTAEVTMNAEAILDEVDQRVERLNQLAAALDARAAAPQSKAEVCERQPEPEPGPVPELRPEADGNPKPKRQRRARPKSEPEPGPRPERAVEPAPQARQEEPGAAPGPVDRYGELRAAVLAMADEGQDPVAIARALGVPRGEVLLLLSLRGKKGQPG